MARVYLLIFPIKQTHVYLTHNACKKSTNMASDCSSGINNPNTIMMNALMMNALLRLAIRNRTTIPIYTADLRECLIDAIMGG